MTAKCNDANTQTHRWVYILFCIVHDASVAAGNSDHGTVPLPLSLIFAFIKVQSNNWTQTFLLSNLAAFRRGDCRGKRAFEPFDCPFLVPVLIFQSLSF